MTVRVEFENLISSCNFTTIQGKEEAVTQFQRYRVHALLNLLQEKFPPPQVFKNKTPTPATSAGGGIVQGDADTKSQSDIKSEKGTESSEQSRGIKREAVPMKSSENQANKKTKYS